MVLYQDKTLKVISLQVLITCLQCKILELQGEITCKSLTSESSLSAFHQGEPMPSKSQAKMVAALRACKLLHKIGELDDDLLPKQTLSDEESDLEEEEAAAESGGKKPKAGTKKRRQQYMRKVSS